MISAPQRRLLIAEDEGALRLAIQRYFSTHGFVVTAVGSGADALTALSDSRFSCAILDVRMPGLSGLELIPRARAIDPDLVIIMLTGVSDAVSASEALERGAFDYLVKPMKLADLHSRVEAALQPRS